MVLILSINTHSVKMVKGFCGEIFFGKNFSGKDFDYNDFFDEDFFYSI